MEKPREFWVTDPNAYSEHWVHTEKEEAEGCGDFIIYVIEKSAYDQLLADARELQKALEECNSLVAGCIHTTMPMLVRELDGSISSVRERTNEGKVYDLTLSAIETFTKKYGAG